MPRTKTLSQIQAKRLAVELKEYTLTMVAMVLGVTILNLVIAWYVRTSDLPFVSNNRPIGFTFDYFSSIGILLLVTWLLHEFKIHVRAGIGTILTLSGLYSNFWKKLLGVKLPIICRFMSCLLTWPMSRLYLSNYP
jgi:hypothetical protein